MSRWLLLDEIHLQVCVPRDALAERQDSARRALVALRLDRRLRRFLTRLIARTPELRDARIRVTR